jgi:hypothetical protein
MAINLNNPYGMVGIQPNIGTITPPPTPAPTIPGFTGFGDRLATIGGFGDDPDELKTQEELAKMTQAQIDQYTKQRKGARRSGVSEALIQFGEALQGKPATENALKRKQALKNMEMQNQYQAEYQAAIQAAEQTNPAQARLLRSLGLPGFVELQQKRAEQMFLGSDKRKIIKAADGYNYYADNGKRVLPGVEKETSIDSQTTDFKNYLNTLDKASDATGAGFLAYQDRNIKKDKMSYNMKQDVNSYWRYTDGPMKGQRVFPDVAKEKDEEEAFNFGDEDKLRDDFRSESKEFVKVRDAYGRILSTDASAAGDLALIFNYMKILDPGSVVREGEFATAQNSAGVPTRIRAQYNKIRTGERLAPETREDFLQQSQNLYQTQADSQSFLESEYQTYAEEYGFKPSRIVTKYGTPIEDKLLKIKLESMPLNELATLDPSQYSEKQLDIIAKVIKSKGKQ